PALPSLHQEIAARVVADARELLRLRRRAQIDMPAERHKPHREGNGPTVALKGREDPRVCPFELGPRFLSRKTNASHAAIDLPFRAGATARARIARPTIAAVSGRD